jgi:hypothetical protein
VSGSVTAPGYCTGVYASSGIVLIAASTALLRAIAKENLAPALMIAAMTLPPQYAESPRTRMLHAWAPAAMAVLIASVSMLAAPFDDPALPARSRTPARTGIEAKVPIDWFDVHHLRPARTSSAAPTYVSLLGPAVFGTRHAGVAGPRRRPGRRSPLRDR